MRLEEFVKNLPRTKPLYWEDSYKRVLEAKILKIEPDEKSAAYFVLDETIFHPKMGGQPDDRGTIERAGFRLEVKKVMLVNHVVIHWGKVLEGIPSLGNVRASIDWNFRYLVMRRHTAGHLLDHCISLETKAPAETLGSWLGDPCYVEYRGTVLPEGSVDGVEATMNELIRKGRPVFIEYVKREDLLKKAIRAPNILRLPILDTYRVVTIENCEPIPCSGTHVKDIKEIGGFHIKSLSATDRGFRVYYDVV
ncbi:alanyl-tRNA editing protein [Candidatus Bathyarchaeota archaeon]|nr:alanyl-tRNA editing protein [Candidatus Bathyarchaeota archaeon]